MNSNRQIEVTPLAMEHPWFKILYKKDRQGGGKPYFQKCIDYLFYMYHEDSPYLVMSEYDRSVTIKATYELEIDEKSEEIKKISEFLKQTMYSTTQYSYINAINDMYKLKEYVSQLPIEQEKRVSHRIPVVEGQKFVDIEHVFKISNIKEKQEAWSSSVQLDKVIKDLEAKTIKEEKKRDSEERRIFDR